MRSLQYAYSLFQEDHEKEAKDRKGRILLLLQGMHTFYMRPHGHGLPKWSITESGSFLPHFNHNQPRLDGSSQTTLLAATGQHYRLKTTPQQNRSRLGSLSMRWGDSTSKQMQYCPNYDRTQLVNFKAVILQTSKRRRSTIRTHFEGVSQANASCSWLRVGMLQVNGCAFLNVRLALLSLAKYACTILRNAGAVGSQTGYAECVMASAGSS